jgi:hypothetical protein
VEVPLGAPTMTMNPTSHLGQTRLRAGPALLDNHTFDPTIHATYIPDFLTETNRIQDRKDVLSYTYTEPLKMVDPALVEVEGQWKP